jgi:hypothetical protein
VEDGLGSSSALGLAVVVAIAKLRGIDLSLWQLASLVHRQQVARQGYGSGCDVATQLLGGFVQFSRAGEVWPGQVRKLAVGAQPWLRVFVGGAGAPTTETLQKTMPWLSTRWSLLKALSDHFIKALTDSLVAGLTPACIEAASKLSFFWQGSPCFAHEVWQVITSLQGFNQGWTIKPTGAGGADALLYIGEPEAFHAVSASLRPGGWEPLMVDWCERGLE